MTRPRPLDHDQLVHLIYDSADHPEGFTHCLAGLGHHIGADTMQLLIIRPDGTPAENHGFTRYEFDAERSGAIYYRDWKDQDPRFQIATRRMGQVISDIDVIDPESFERSAIYNEHLIRTHVRYSLFSTTRIDQDHILAPALFRSRSESAFGPVEVSRLNGLLPHMIRASRMRLLGSKLLEAREDLRHALDTSPSALALLDRRGGLVATNALLESLLRTDTLRTEHGVLTGARPDETRALTAAIDQTARLADAGSRPGAAAPPATATVSRPDSAPLTVVLSPLRPRNALRERGARSARVLAIVHDPERRVRLRHDLVVRLHGLTATEAHVAVALAEGQSLDEIATARGISAQTARTHMKRILDKTGAGRQAELVRVLLTGLAAHQLR